MEKARKIRPEYYEKLDKEKEEKQEKLWDLCERFISENEISCEESIHQCDWVNENSYELIEEICKIVGYYDTHPDVDP